MVVTDSTIDRGVRFNLFGCLIFERVKILEEGLSVFKVNGVRLIYTLYQLTVEFQSPGRDCWTTRRSIREFRLLVTSHYRDSSQLTFLERSLWPANNPQSVSDPYLRGLYSGLLTIWMNPNIFRTNPSIFYQKVVEFRLVRDTAFGLPLSFEEVFCALEISRQWIMS